MLCTGLNNVCCFDSLGLGKWAELNSWGRISITLLLCYVVYLFGQCVLFRKPWTRDRGRAELMGKDFNNSAALLCCVLLWAMCNLQSLEVESGEQRNSGGRISITLLLCYVVYRMVVVVVEAVVVVVAGGGCCW